jgi:DNA polymerase zeta
VFGATETGQKVCAHIHGALPYLYLEYDGSLEKDIVETYITDLRASIDQALTVSYRRNAHDRKSYFVGHITLVKGVPFYGYHVGYRFFLKVYLLNPLHMTRLVDLLAQGAILDRVFQTYESHLSYLLQWMCDYNLYGCAYINCAKVQFRGPVPSRTEMKNSAHKWHDESIPGHTVAFSDQYPRQSHCSIEVDVHVQDILNRNEVVPRPIHHDFFERFSDLGPEDKFVPAMAGLWRDETRRRKLRMGLTDPSSSPFPAELLVSMSADPRNSEKGGWVHEEEYRQVIDGLIREEQDKSSRVSFETFVKRVDGEDRVQTAIESIEDLFPHNLPSLGLPEDSHFEEGALDIFEPEDVLQELEGNMQDDEGGEKKEEEDLGSLDPLSLSEALAEGKGANPLKRGPDLAQESVNKRQRIMPPSNSQVTPATKRVTFQDAHSETGPPHRSQKDSTEEGNTSSQSSQSSIKAHGGSGPTPMSFPVVKNPNAPDTVQRLSQNGTSKPKSPRTPSMRRIIDSSNGSPRTPWSLQRSSPRWERQNSSIANREAVSLVSQLGNRLSQTSSRTLYYAHLPPPADVIETTMTDFGLPPVIYQDAYYSEEADVPDRPREYAGREFRLQSKTLPYLPLFDQTGQSPASLGQKPRVLLDRAKERASTEFRKQRCGTRHWEIAAPPPSRQEVDNWLKSESRKDTTFRVNTSREQPNSTKGQGLSQIDGPTQKNKHGFKFSQKQKATTVQHEIQYMTIMSLEVHVNCRGTLAPDPAKDEIACVFWCIEGEQDGDGKYRAGILCLSSEDDTTERTSKQSSVEVQFEEDELDLINRLVDIVRQFDPDILTGYEVHNTSWGYLIERARLKYEYNLCDEISRMILHSHGRFGKEADRWGFTKTSTVRVTGRHVINIWRAMRGELNLLQYTMENVVFHLLHKRIPHYTYQDLTAWYTSGTPRDLTKVISYYTSRVQMNLQILEANEIIPRTSEQARLLGIDFFSVISRGSQFKVEATMYRIAKPENFILVSPTRQQVGQQNALECLPLVMEPQSDFYSSPVVVLDFQSLYPSVMIAYNYCYSTCLGRVVSWRGRNKMGPMDYKREPQLLGLVKDHITIAPNGIIYVNQEMRKSLLAKMLGEILETRVMVKSGMKQDKDDRTLQQLLNNRQLALKLLANVTYGYASASFSGRMPCSEIADSIVQTGRETLEKAIALIHSNEHWGAEVVYGDTDSLFVHLKGRTREQAFTIGEEIAKAVTDANPKPIKLKFEKVYHPCVLLAKKRYVGSKYESRNQKEPYFDAKGIETVRRDGTPAIQKIEEKALKLLFRTSDLSEVKRYFQNQCTKIMSGRISIHDFFFAKEVKLGTYSDKGPPPPGALIATKRMLADKRAEPEYGERVPYVVVTGAPGARLIDRCVSPETLMRNEYMELDGEYYITKNIIPPLERIFNLVGANVRQWYDEMPKVQRIRNISIPVFKHGAGGNQKRTLESYMQSSTCLLCRNRLPPPSPDAANNPSPYSHIPLCISCLRRPARTLLTLHERIRTQELKVKNVDMVCRSCASLAFNEEVMCDNRDCPVFYTRVKEKTKMKGMNDTVSRVVEILQDANDGREVEAPVEPPRKRQKLDW